MNLDWFRTIHPKKDYSPENLFCWCVDEFDVKLAAEIQKTMNYFKKRDLPDYLLTQVNDRKVTLANFMKLGKAINNSKYEEVIGIMSETIEFHNSEGRWQSQLNWKHEFSYEHIFAHAMDDVHLAHVGNDGYGLNARDGSLPRLEVATVAFNARRMIMEDTNMRYRQLIGTSIFKFSKKHFFLRFLF